MIWLKPETGLRLQQIVAQYEISSDNSGVAITDEVEEFMQECPVCDDDGCSKAIVKANGVYVHPEDVEDAAEITRPTLVSE
jgi:hypothetical protein